MSKVCYVCDVEQPLSEFSEHSGMADGHLNKCKSCTRAYTRNRRMDPVFGEQMREKDRERFQTPERRAYALAQYRSRNAREPGKYQARTAVGNAIRDGRLTRQPCVICGNPLSEAHHHDHSKPLEVLWLCFKHHRELAHNQTVSN